MSAPDSHTNPFEDTSLPAPRISDLARGRGPGHVPDYLQGLNPEQRAAVEATEGPVLVLAGAGTGKTRVLTTRLAHILASGKARPWELLVVTFTNKAAREMRERITHIIGPEAEGLRWLGTFHSVAAQILRRHAELVGLKSNFTILDTDDQERLIKQVLEAENVDPKRWTPKALAGLIDHWKNRGWTPEKLPPSEGAAFGPNKGQKLYALYQARLRVLNACDFGDLLLHNLTIFQTKPDVLAEFHRRFKYILVDEYQDTNVSQYLWLRLLGQASQNVCCVGDDDQSIYGWRGAEVDNILRFERDFPGATVIRLERNYRSTSHILAAASGLISSNKGRLGKTLWTEQNGGEKVIVRGVWDGEAESRLIADEIERARKGGTEKAPRKYRDMAILVRASFQMRAFEERFVLLSIPYTVVGGPRFFERAEIRDAHAYLRLIQSPDDDLAFERIVNTPKRGIGDSSVQKLLQIARLGGVPVMTAAREVVLTDELPARTRTQLANFIRDVDRWRAQAQTVAHARLTEQVLEESGYTDALRLDKTPTAQTRLENLKELVQSMGAFDTLEAYLEHVSLVMDMDRGPQADAVQIMDPALGQGAGVPAGLPARLGGRGLPLPAQHGRERREGPRGGAPPGLCRHHPGPGRGADLLRRQPPGLWPLDQPAAQPLRRRTAPGQCRGLVRDRLLRRRSRHAAARQPLGRNPQLRRRLHFAGLETGPGAQLPRQPSGPAAGDRGRRPPGRGVRQLPRQRLFARRPGVPSEVRLRQGDRRRGQQAHRQLRQGRREEGDRLVRREGLRP